MRFFSLLLLLSSFSLFAHAGLFSQQWPPPLAPFEEGDPSLWIPNRYSVSLDRNYTLAQHWAALGQDLSKTGQQFSYMEEINVYSFTTTDDYLIYTIRMDAGVSVVSRVTTFPLDMPAATNATTPNDPATNASTSRLCRHSEEQKKWDKSLWTDEAYWFTSMLTAGEQQHDLDEDRCYNYDIVEDPVAGAGVRIYILDSGIMLHHPDFITKDTVYPWRAFNFQDKQWDDKSPYCDETMEPSGAHGTCVASIAGAWFAGIAPAATLINVKVLCQGHSWESVTNAIRDMTKEHKANKEARPAGWKGSVINISWGNYGRYDPLRQAIEEAYNAGIPIVAAAGNNDTDASEREAIPCSYDHVFCVASVDKQYTKAVDSNYGAAINILAPGVDIECAALTGGKHTMSGTSCAAPHVAGMMAIYLSIEGPDLSTAMAYQIARDNGLWDICSGFPRKWWWWPTTDNLFATTGINHPNRNPLYPYARERDDLLNQNQCHLNLTQVWTCEPAGENMYGRVSISDANGKLIYTTPGSTGSPGVPLNDDGDPWEFQETGMAKNMSIVASNATDYVQFWYGRNLTWGASSNSVSSQDDKAGQCYLDGPDWYWAGPTDCPNGPSVTRQFVCHYPCDG